MKFNVLHRSTVGSSKVRGKIILTSVVNLKAPHNLHNQTMPIVRYIYIYPII